MPKLLGCRCGPPDLREVSWERGGWILSVDWPTSGCSASSGWNGPGTGSSARAQMARRRWSSAGSSCPTSSSSMRICRSCRGWRRSRRSWLRLRRPGCSSSPRCHLGRPGGVGPARRRSTDPRSGGVGSASSWLPGIPPPCSQDTLGPVRPRCGPSQDSCRQFGLKPRVGGAETATGGELGERRGSGQGSGAGRG
jgi:hypothetical protein